MSFWRLVSGYYRVRFRLAKLRCHLLPPVRALVLDIGSGDGPSPSADVLCDRFLDDTERTAGLRLDRPFVLGDVEDLPFLDGAFDFVYCSHLLEHTQDPARAMAELQRVARSGYIEVPSEYLEKAAKSTASHFWFVRREDGVLVFTPKAAGVLDPYLNDLFDHRLIYRDQLFTAFHFARFYSLYNIGLTWRDRIPYRINGRPALEHREEFEKGTEEVPSAARIRAMRQRAAGGRANAVVSTKGWIKRLIRRRYARGKSFDLLRLVACPVCKGPVTPEPERDRLVCPACHLAFPWVEGVPCLLKGAAASTAGTAVRS